MNWGHKRPLFAGFVFFFDPEISIKASFLKICRNIRVVWLLVLNIFAFLMLLRMQKFCVAIFCVYISKTVLDMICYYISIAQVKNKVQQLTSEISRKTSARVF
jgi:hypothetical protein